MKVVIENGKGVVLDPLIFVHKVVSLAEDISSERELLGRWWVRRSRWLGGGRFFDVVAEVKILQGKRGYHILGVGHDDKQSEDRSDNEVECQGVCAMVRMLERSRRDRNRFR